MSPLITSIAIGMAATAQVSPGDSVTFDGFVVVAIDAIEVPAREPGALTAVMVDDGDAVKVDQQLAQIDDRIAKHAVQVAASKFKSAKRQAENEINKQLAIAQTNVYQAELDVANEANKLVRNTFSVTEVRRLDFRVQQGQLSEKQADFDQGVAKLDAVAAYAELQQAEAMLDRRKIRSPLDGVVVKVALRPGNWVSPGDAVMKVVRMDQLRVRGRLPYDQYSQFGVRGKRVTINIDVGGGTKKSFQAQMGFASDEVDENGDFEVWAQIDNIKSPDGSWLVSPGANASIKF